MSQFDFHMHSTFSDGSDAPEEILEKAVREGLSHFALTDHDTFAGCPVIEERLPDYPEIRFVRGIELSCRDEYGKYHILGYGFRPDSPEIRALVSRSHKIRLEKDRKRIQLLEERFSFSFTEEDMKELFAHKNPGKPHIGNLMVRKGYAKTMKEAIEQYINQCRVKAGHTTPAEAIPAILSGGGIPVLAHPVFGSGSQLLSEEELETRILRLKDLGLKGLECFYSRNDPGQTGWLLEAAGKNSLMVTAGSDYHGKNKTVRMGENGLTKERLPKGMEEFMEAVF